MVFKKKVIKRQPIYKVFEGRMKREGRYEEYNRRYKEYKKQGIEWSKAKGMVRDEMGFQGPDIEREIEERFKLWGEAGIPEQIISATDKKNQAELIEVLGEFDINESELPIDIAFVFHNLHKAVGEQSEWKVSPPEAPTPGAWNMLMWASINQTKFFDKVLGDQLKQGNKTEDQGMGDTGESIEQIEQMLTQLSEVSNEEDVLQNGNGVLRS
jgi:hypothetical protein